MGTLCHSNSELSSGAWLSYSVTGQADNSHNVETILTGTSQPFIKTIEERSGLELVGRMFT